ncbi:MAG: helix-turn-helix domain-containing protein [Oscillospiraceae bacterium]|nr:helix-turn-helix domain-containing protein [Oscillospiraceae bacterium]
MKITLASNLKRLRQKRALTQEILAGFLGISFQAVSKWERGEGYPDITLLPRIAGFFGVTIDELLGMNDVRSGERLAGIHGQWEENNAQGKHDENIALMRESLKDYPDDWLLMVQLVTSLEKCGAEPDRRQKNKAEAIALSEKIVRHCDGPAIKNAFLFNLCDSYHKNGDTEKAIEGARQLPIIYKTQENALVMFLKGEEKIDVGQRAILALVSCLFHQVSHMTDANHYFPNEKIAALGKCIAAAEILLEGNDCPSVLRHKAAAYMKMANIYLEQGRREDALDCLTRAVESAERSASLPGEFLPDSLLANRVSEKAATPDDVGKLGLSRLLTDAKYEPLRADERFRELCGRVSILPAADQHPAVSARSSAQSS